MWKANRRIYGVLEEAASVPRNPEKVALKMVPVISEGENGTMIKASAFLVLLSRPTLKSRPLIY